MGGGWGSGWRVCRGGAWYLVQAVYNEEFFFFSEVEKMVVVLGRSCAAPRVRVPSEERGRSGERNIQPLLEIQLGVENRRHQKIQQRPNLHDVVLQRRTYGRQSESGAPSERLERKGKAEEI